MATTPILPQPSTNPTAYYPFVPKPTPTPFLPPVPTGLSLSKQDIYDLFASQTANIVNLITTMQTNHQQQITQLQLDHQHQITSLIDLHTKELQTMRDFINTMKLQYDQNTNTLLHNMNAILTSHQLNNDRFDTNIRTFADINTRNTYDNVLVDRIDGIKTTLELQIGTMEADLVTAVRGPLAGQGFINVLGTKEITNDEANAMTVKELTYLFNKVSSMHKVYTKRQTDKPTEKRRQTIDAMARNLIIMKDVRDRKKRHEGGIIPL